MTTNRRELNKAVVRFCGDSGDGMQLTGSQFTATTAAIGNEIRAALAAQDASFEFNAVVRGWPGCTHKPLGCGRKMPASARWRASAASASDGERAPRVRARERHGRRRGRGRGAHLPRRGSRMTPLGERGRVERGLALVKHHRGHLEPSEFESRVGGDRAVVAG